MSGGLSFKCEVCGDVFTSVMMFDLHISTHSPTKFFSTYLLVAQNEIKQGRGAGLQQILDTYITPKLVELRQLYVPISKKRLQTIALAKHRAARLPK